ncbi:hypothetical protein [Viscerimonas tarda]
MNSNIVTARIDVSKPEGRQIVRELESKKSVELDYPMPDELAEAIAGERTYTMEEAFGALLDRLSIHYGVDMHKLSKHDI